MAGEAVVSINANRVSPEIRLELVSGRDAFVPQMQAMVSTVGVPDGPAAALANLQAYLTDRNALIVNARIGRRVVGFMVLDPESMTAPFSWVERHFRDKGLGQRFYSFACINLGMPAPEFTFHEDMLDEYRSILKNLPDKPVLKDSFYVLHERPAEAA